MASTNRKLTAAHHARHWKAHMYAAFANKKANPTLAAAHDAASKAHAIAEGVIRGYEDGDRAVCSAAAQALTDAMAAPNWSPTSLAALGL